MEIESTLQKYLTDFLDYLPRLISGLVIFVITLWGAGFIAKWTKKLVGKKVESKELQRLVFLLTKWMVIILGTIFALDQVNFDVTSFIAGLGIAGFTIGFALQDIAKNFVSGMLLLYRQPFVIGDLIKASDFEGKVKAINIRDTVIETLDGELVIIPNKDVYENPIINFTHTQYRRKVVKIGLGYDENADHAIEIFTEKIKSIQGVDEAKGVSIQADALGDSTLSLSAYYWVDQQTYKLLDVQSEVIKAIKVAAEENDINLPYPIKTVILKHDQD